ALSPAAGAREQDISISDADATLWAALVDGHPVEVRRTADAFLIPLPASDDPTVERLLELFYRTRVPALRGTGELRQPPPELTVLNGAGVSQPMQVLDQQWELRYPQDLLLTDSKGAFVPDSPLRTTSWLTRLPQKLTMPRWADAGRMIVAIVFVLIVVGFVWIGFRLGWVGGIGIGISLSLLFLVAVFYFTFAIQGQKNATNFAEATKSLDGVGGFGVNDNADDGDGKAVEFFDRLGAMGGRPRAGRVGAPAAPPMAVPLSEAMPEVAASDAPVEQLDRLSKKSAEKRFDKESKKLSDSTAGKVAKDSVPAMKPITALPRLEGEVFDGETKADGDKSGFIIDGKKFTRIAGPISRAEAKAPLPSAHYLDDDVQYFPPGPGSLAGDAGGLLSLTMALEGQADAAVKKFRYLGTETAGNGIGLEVVYENRAAGWTGRWLWMAALAFVAWLIPLAARNVRVYWSILGLTLPLALAPLAPMPWQNALDGIFFGTLAAIALWTSRCLCDAFCAALPQMKSKAFWTRSLSQQAEVVKGA
ncbi:MAG: hypothetical protein NT013_17120, partial [Planctomycetia bacterium]|nr:hypothetical protein [Planctomycetia bacterium]